ncbi:MAG: CatB-related O-acetyltransferase [Prevotella sp.]|nr:CatB-related O-acetyltransferase [Prevotella sp.]
MNKIKNWIIILGRKIFRFFLQKEMYVFDQDMEWDSIMLELKDTKMGKNVKIYRPSHIYYSEIGDYTYISKNASISRVHIGKCCSIGPNILCGWGDHPTNGISTSPMFYSTRRQNGITLTDKDKMIERKEIAIGNDVFIGANVTILDGITIGDGAIIGAGAVVSKDIPAYAIAVGCPIKIKKYRFNDDQIAALKRIQWWNFEAEQLQDVERMFWNIDEFIKKYDVA